jgi:peptide-methionine (S)-S-oxide reductase
MENKEKDKPSGKTEIATFGAGCFWCVEADSKPRRSRKSCIWLFWRLGSNPTYRAVCTGTIGHAEVCQVIYDPQKLLLKSF